MKTKAYFLCGFILFLLKTAAAAELLSNAGFESGDLTSWNSAVGQGVIVPGSGETDPGAPRSGSFVFSASATDGGNRLGGEEITISQAVDVSDSAFIAAGQGWITASGFFAGAFGVGSVSSDDLAQLRVEFRQGGASGGLVGAVETIAIDPTLGFWNVLTVAATPVPVTTDTIVFRVQTFLDPGFFSIDIAADDLSLELFNMQPSADSDGDGVLDVSDNCLLAPNADQRDTNNDGFGNACDADLNNDCIVNVVDLGLLRAVFFSADGDADFNGDGVVNVVDLGVLRSGFFAAPGPSGVDQSCGV